MEYKVELTGNMVVDGRGKLPRLSLFTGTNLEKLNKARRLRELLVEWRNSAEQKQADGRPLERPWERNLHRAPNCKKAVDLITGKQLRISKVMSAAFVQEKAVRWEFVRADGKKRWTLFPAHRRAAITVEFSGVQPSEEVEYIFTRIFDSELAHKIHVCAYCDRLFLAKPKAGKHLEYTTGITCSSKCRTNQTGKFATDKFREDRFGARRAACAKYFARLDRKYGNGSALEAQRIYKECARLANRDLPEEYRITSRWVKRYCTEIEEACK